MSFEILNIDVALQISNEILFEESFGDALINSINKFEAIQTLVNIYRYKQGQYRTLTNQINE